MVRKRKSGEEKLLTEVELELMSVLWRLGEGSVADVLAILPADRKLAYTSVSTILRILEQKEVLTAKRVGRGHVYVPLLPKSAYESKVLQHVVSSVFEGAPVAMVKQLLGTGKLQEKDLEEIRDFLEKRKA